MCVLLLPLVLALVAFFAALNLLHIKSDSTLNDLKIDSEKVLTGVFKNLNADPIVEIQTQYNNQCGSGFEELSIGSWGAINEGCLCYGDDPVKAKVVP